MPRRQGLRDRFRKVYIRENNAQDAPCCGGAEVIGLRLACGGSKPSVSSDAFVHKDAVVIGNVSLSARSSVWPGAVLAAFGRIQVGEGSNIQRQCVMNCRDVESQTVVGRYSTIGRGAILNECRVGDYCVVGNGAVILEDAVIGDFSVIGEGSLVPRHAVIPPKSLVFGNPAQVQGTIDEYSLQHIQDSARRYMRMARKYQ